MTKCIDNCCKTGRDPKTDKKNNVADNSDKDECYKVDKALLRPQMMEYM